MFSWWFEIFFIFTPSWGNDPILLIFFRWVETTNWFAYVYQNNPTIHVGQIYPFFPWKNRSQDPQTVVAKFHVPQLLGRRLKGHPFLWIARREPYESCV